jgi:hypothetical protein
MVKAHRVGERTITADPQKGTVRSRLPFLKLLALNKPCSSVLMMDVPRHIVIYRRIRRREPSLQGLSRVIPCNVFSLSGQ